MELAADTKQIRYSPTATPILDLLQPLPSRRRLRLSAGEYFFLSGAVILALIGLPLLRRVVEPLSSLGSWRAILVASFLIPGAALLLSQAGHELGHLAAAMLTGFGRIKPSGSSGEDANLGDRDFRCDNLRIAACGLVPRKTDSLRRRLFFLYAAGPATNFLLAAVTETAAWGGQWGSVATFFAHVFAGISTLQGIADLIPDTSRGSFSDGSRMLMLLKNEAYAQRWMTILEFQLALQGGENPASWNEARVLSLIAIRDDSCDAVAGRWLAFLWATAQQDITSATRYLEDALETHHAASRRLRDRLCFEAAWFQAWYRDDPAKARHWADAVSHDVGKLQQPRLDIAFMWAEGKLFDSWQKLSDYLRRIHDLPVSPARDAAERQAREWKSQMESRMLTRAWRTIYAMSQEVEASTPQPAPAKV